MKEPLVSVIVPVYKVEQYLERCVDSILNQTYRNLEVILVDDGSPDSCPEMCDAYAQRDERVKVIHQKNGGPSSARNTGMHTASGKYILFVDSDDWLHINACERLVEHAEKLNCQIVYAKNVQIVDGKDVHMSREPTLGKCEACDGRSFLVSGVQQKAMEMCVPYGIYNREFLIDNGAFFEEGISFEDELWIPQVYLKAKAVSYLDYEFYYRFQHEGSITQTREKGVQERRAQNLIHVCDELKEVYLGLPKFDRTVLCDYLCMLYLNAVYIGQLTDEDRRFPLQTAHSLRNRVKAMIHAVSPSFYIWLNRTVKRAGTREMIAEEGQ